MAQSLPNNAVSTQEPSSLEAAHKEVLADTSFQFEHATKKLREDPPKWVEAIIDFLAQLGPVFNILFWVALVLLLGLLAYFILTEIVGVRFFKSKASASNVETVPEWQPTARDARDLLAAADALAAQGQYDEAVHLILLRSIEDLDRRRPLAVRPALTARDIAAIPVLPERARPAFWRIASAVEQVLFAGRTIDKDEFKGCRDAYVAFALPDGWAT
jgi:hypothetical protein